jgi:o-succinylbenzoate synthase
VKLVSRAVAVGADGAQHARRSWPVRESLLVGLTEPSGAWGLGEAAPLPGYSPEALGDVERVLADVSTDELTRALDHESPRDALEAAAALVPRTAPSARFALETAALDLMSRRRGCSAPALLGAARDAQRPLAALLGPASSPSLVEAAERAFEGGYRCFKLKLGAPGALSRELEGAASLRRRFGAALRLRVDANGALSSAEVTSHAATLESLDLELFEEPGAPLPRAVPLALDESLQGLSLADAETAWVTRSARAIVLKPTALGGLAHCWLLAERAAAGGVSATLSHAFEGPVAWRAAAALALALPNAAPHGLGPHGALAAWPGATPLPVTRGSLRAWPEPGLGYSWEHAFP